MVGCERCRSILRACSTCLAAHGLGALSWGVGGDHRDCGLSRWLITRPAIASAEYHHRPSTRPEAGFVCMLLARNAGPSEPAHQAASDSLVPIGHCA